MPRPSRPPRGGACEPFGSREPCRMPMLAAPRGRIAPRRRGGARPSRSRVETLPQRGDAGARRGHDGEGSGRVCGAAHLPVAGPRDNLRLERVEQFENLLGFALARSHLTLLTVPGMPVTPPGWR